MTNGLNQSAMIPETSTNHLLDLASMNLDIQTTRKKTGQTLIWLTVLHWKLPNRVFPHLHFLWHRDNALPIVVEWAGNLFHVLVRNFMAQRRLRNESLAVTLLFSRAEIILFSTESSSFNEVRQLLSEGPKLKAWQRLSNDDAFPNNPRLELQNWNLFTNGPKRAYNLMPSFMKGLRSRPCPCRPSQVSSGRQSFGQKRVWLLFLTWSYTT